jgi:D-alanyl-D-alanine-carboxypeptidase/D-alanyl-D-alanine-endopeptidase
MKKIIIVITVLLAFISTVSIAQSRIIADNETIANVLKHRIDTLGRGMGAVVGVIDANGKRVISYGKFDHQESQPLNGDTIFEIGSITKVFTGMLLADMVERGEVKLDDPVQKYLPEKVKLKAKDGIQITLENLSVQNSGLPRLPNNFISSNFLDPYSDYTAEKMYAFLSNFEPKFKPGENWTYSNIGVGLLGHVLSLRAGMSYEELVIERILKPLGMNDTSITLTDDQKARFATGHNSALAATNAWAFKALAGAGALRSSINDMLIFAEANLGLTDSPLSKAMQNSHMPRMALDDQDPGSKIGLNWIIYSYHDSQIVWHNGGTGGFSTFLGIDKENKTAVVILTNSQNSFDDIGFHLLNSNYEISHPKPRN